jgi:hypothetical protein
VLAPPWLGGSTTYLVVHETSMEPRFRAGDHVVVRRAPDYRVGQIVAYRSRTLDTVVVHRLVRRDDPGYVFKETTTTSSTLSPAEPGGVSRVQERPRELAVGRFELDVTTARRVGSVCLVAGRRADPDEASRISEQYGSRLASARRSDDNVVEFDSMDTLVSSPKLSQLKKWASLSPADGRFADNRLRAAAPRGPRAV